MDKIPRPTQRRSNSREIHQASDLRVLLMQIRAESSVCREEHESFALYSGLSKSQIDILNVFETPTFGPEVIEGYDALFVGGGSEASVLEPEKYPFLVNAQRLLIHSIERSTPVFASCFGFQLAVLALGGEIIRDEVDFEMGTIPIRLTEAAKHDPLFYDLNDQFVAVAVHKESAITAPQGCELLAYTEACCHAFRVRGKPFWAFQFHPEVDRRTLVERLTVYRQQYTQDTEHLDRVLAASFETPESNALVKKFVDRILLATVRQGRTAR